ncbi:hypothetical protein, conserved [Plasmodium gonderi]|uniref:Uncharacterized protein n=1 Tax=Plasmodium gonderi TaxID=77519 RepID=A0A1Y1JH72_PLAGO|nr:hypothetical protein, conserved [Plasmodium gonderi]GAW80557.1 hypothetical protein, conserved [Plasmodium gonderi]
MNKENTEKLISIINLLDKISESNDVKNPNYNKLKSFFSSELSKTFDSLENHKSLFPLNYENDASDSNTNKIINEIKKTKSLFYFNKSCSSEKEKPECLNNECLVMRKGGSLENLIENDLCVEGHMKKEQHMESKHSIPQACVHTHEQHSRKEDLIEIVNKRYTHFDDTRAERKDASEFMETNAFVIKTNHIAKINMIHSFDTGEFSFVKGYTSSFKYKRDSHNISREYFSDTELLSYNNSSKKKKNLLEMLRKKNGTKKYTTKLNMDSMENSTFTAPLKKHENVLKEIDAGEFLDNKDLAQLLEKIIEHLKFNLRETISRYVKEINKLNKKNGNLSIKLETAVENNDEQAQEIRDLNKRINQIKEEKTEMNKLIESYEFEMHMSKKFKNERENDGKIKNALEQEIKNLKRELNMANSLNDKINNENHLLQERIKNKIDKLRQQKGKLKIANNLILEKSDLLTQLQLPTTVHIPSVKIGKKYIARKRTVPYQGIKEVVGRHQSDTILDNYMRIKNKLFESNEKCYFLSKTNLELFKGLKKKKKKIHTLNKQVSYLKYFMKEREKINQFKKYKLNEDSTDTIDHMDINKSHIPCVDECKPKVIDESNSFVNICNDFDISKFNYNVQVGETQSLEKVIHNITNEYNLIKKKYELLYKKYLKLLEMESNKNKDFAFIRQKTEETAQTKCGVIHSFYLKKGENNLKKKYHGDIKLINYIKAKVIDRNNLNVKKFRNYKEEGVNYSDVQFYVSNEILKSMDVKDIVNIRYIYSYGEAPANPWSQNGSVPKYHICRC